MLRVHFQFLPVFVLIHTKCGVRAKSVLKYLYTIIPGRVILAFLSVLLAVLIQLFLKLAQRYHSSLIQAINREINEHRVSRSYAC